MNLLFKTHKIKLNGFNSNSAQSLEMLKHKVCKVSQFFPLESYCISKYTQK